MLKFIIIGLVSIFSSTIQAQQRKLENSLLWEISGQNLKKPSYLFGTYHFAGQDFLDTMNVLKEKLQEAKIVVGEVLLDNTLAVKMGPYMKMDNETIDQLLSPADYLKVAAYLKQTTGFDLALFKKMKPVVIQMTILQFTAPKTISEKNIALDQFIQDFAKKNNKKVLGLETIEDQAQLLFGSSLERQAQLLVKNVNEAEKTRQEGEKLYAYYCAQNLNELEKLLHKTEDFTPEELDKMLKNRNQKWMNQLGNLILEGNIFIAVGAGHLIGEEGLINLLRKKGYVVKAISTS